MLIGRKTALELPIRLSLPVWLRIARAYPLTRAAHAKILEQLEARDGER
jgi:Na+/melibiose symporter-like transporter